MRRMFEGRICSGPSGLPKLTLGQSPSPSQVDGEDKLPNSSHRLALRQAQDGGGSRSDELRMTQGPFRVTTL